MVINYSQKHILPPKLFEELEGTCPTYLGTEEGKADQIVKMKDVIISSAKSHNFCREVTYKPKKVGPHPCNREGEGLSDLRAQSRVQVMKAGGFSKATIHPNSI